MNGVTYFPYHYFRITYHFERDHVEADGILQAQHECFLFRNVVGALELQAAWNKMFLVLWVDQDTLGSWAILCLWFVEVHGPQLICTWTVRRTFTTATSITTATVTNVKMYCTCFISISWARKETQLHVWWGWSWPCGITPQRFFQEAVAEHEICEGQRFIFAIDGRDTVPHVSLE